MTLRPLLSWEEWPVSQKHLSFLLSFSFTFIILLYSHTSTMNERVVINCDGERKREPYMTRIWIRDEGWVKSVDFGQMNKRRKPQEEKEKTRETLTGSQRHSVYCCSHVVWRTLVESHRDFQEQSNIPSFTKDQSMCPTFDTSDN